MDLFEAVKKQDISRIRKIINSGFDINFKFGDKKRTALMLAALDNNLDVVSLLIELGANVNVKEKTGMTALMLASARGHYKIAQLLVESGANINIQDQTKYTALMYGVEWQHYKVIKILIESGANVNVKTEEGITPLYRAVETSNLEVIKILLLAGANPNVNNSKGQGLFVWSFYTQNTEIVKTLILSGVDIHSKDKTEKTPLQAASGTMMPEMVKILLEAGAKITVENNSQVLWTAINDGADEILKLLIEADANVRSLVPMPEYGFTGLMWATFLGHTNIVEILLTAGVDVKTKNNKGETALDIAISKGHNHIANMLLRASENKMGDR